MSNAEQYSSFVRLQRQKGAEIFLSTMKEKNGEKKHLAHCVKSGCQLTGAIVVVAISPWSLYCIFFWVGCKTIPLLTNNL